MLKINKSTNLNANIQVEGKNVMFLNATINELGSVTFGKTVQNVELYKANIEEVNKQVTEFQEEVKKAELDSLGGELDEIK